MLEVMSYLLIEVVIYGQGYWALRLLSAGRIRPDRWNQAMVCLIGVLVTVAWCVPLLLWLTGEG